MPIDLTGIRLKNRQKAAAQQAATATPPLGSGSTANGGTTVITGGNPMDTANAIAAAQKANTVATTQKWVATPTGHQLQDVPNAPATAAPAPKTYSGLDIYGDTSGKKSTAAPMVTAGTAPTKTIDLNSYKYGQQAADANVKDPTYLTNRNNDLAQHYAGQNMTDSASILNDLKKNTAFSMATIEEQNNTARAIADRIAAQKAEQQKGEQGQWSVTSNNSLTGIDQLNTDLDKLVKEGNKASNQTVDAFINTRIQVDKNKANYTNFDAVEAKAQNINTALRGVFMEKYKAGDANFMNPPTPEEIQAIAQKTGTSVEDVNQFLQGKLFETQLVETDEYRQKVGKSFDRNIEDLTTAKDRQLQDLDLKLKYAEEDTNYQIQEVEKMLERNINVTAISGGLSGALQSSNYVQGMTNIKNDAQTAITRIKDLWKRQQTATGIEKEEILKAYSTAVSRAKTDLEDGFKDIRANAELQLSNAKQKYNLDPENLLNALTTIGENVDMNKINVFNNYVGAMNNVFSTVQSSINMVNAAEDRIMGKQEKVMDYYTMNNGLALMNAKPSDIAEQVKSGVLSTDQAKTLMQYKVGLTTNTLRNAGINANMQQITEMLSVQNMSPQEVLSSFGITTPTVNSTTPTVSSYTNPGNLDGRNLFATLRAGKFNGNKFFGVYATGDPTGERGAQLYDKSVSSGLGNFIQSYAGTKITEEMVINSANKYGIDPHMIAATMALDSSMGTKGKGARNNNPGNVGQFDSLDAKGITVAGYKTLQEGVDAVAENLAKRANALGSVGGGVSGPKEYTESQKNMMRQMDSKNISGPEKTMLQKIGLTPDDVYNYKAERNNNRRQNGMNDDEIKRVNAMADDFYATPTAKTFNKVQEAYNFADSVKKGDKATDNQALIYAFAKAMDPDSVVREGEYSTVQKYSQTRGDKLGMNINRVLNGEEFVSEKAKQNIVDTIKSKYTASKGQYDTERKTYIRRINDYSGGEIGEKVIPSNVVDTIQNTNTNYDPTQYASYPKGGNTASSYSSR